MAVFGEVDLSLADTACAMPVSVQIDRLRVELGDRFERAPAVVSVDLYGLDPGPELDAALDAVVAGESSPFVLVGGRVVCIGKVDIDSVVAALA